MPRSAVCAARIRRFSTAEYDGYAEYTEYTEYTGYNTKPFAGLAHLRTALCVSTKK